ncbi:MAG: GNAT family N-acetyltransferase [Eggerthellaceae bacterium]|nr:GNAT family N-acetyltransferase [Eggerthellaceae bacterium]
MDNALIRYATPADVPVILQLVRELAEYEHAANQVVATEDLLLDELFEKHHAEVLLAEVDGDIAGFALFFHNFSTWLGRAGIYLEDLFVRPAYRKQGLGHALLQRLAAIAVERNCGRLEWACLDWNQPSIDFYLSLGAQRMDEWTTYRVAGVTLEAMVRDDALASTQKR